LTEDDHVSNGTSRNEASAELFYVVRRGEVQSRQWKLKDTRSITQRSQDKRNACLPTTQVPTNLADYCLDMDSRNPGGLDINSAVFVCNNGVAWQ
jgi:hypothetical protein